MSALLLLLGAGTGMGGGLVQPVYLYPPGNFEAPITNNLPSQVNQIGAPQNGSLVSVGSNVNYQASNATAPGSPDLAQGNPTKGFSGSFAPNSTTAVSRVPGPATIGDALVVNSKFNPATLSLTSWFRANFTGSPWVGTASNGVSGSRSASGGAPPSVGPLVNGLAPASFNGVNQILTYDALNTVFFGGVGSVWYLFNSAFAPPFNAAVSQNGNVLTDSANAETTFGLTSGGVTACILTGAGYKSSVIPTGVGQWHLAQWKWDGTNLRGRVDSGAWTNTAAGLYVPTTPSALRMGESFAAANWYQGLLAEVATSNVVITDADFDNVKSYVNMTYNLTL